MNNAVKNHSPTCSQPSVVFNSTLQPAEKGDKVWKHEKQMAITNKKAAQKNILSRIERLKKLHDELAAESKK